MPKTIFLNPDDDISAIIEKITDSEFPEIFLVVPKYSASHFKKNLSDFIAIEKEASQANKQVIICSDDQNVLRLAKATGFLIRLAPVPVHSKKTLSDILPPQPISIPKTQKLDSEAKAILEEKVLKEITKEEPVLNKKTEEEKIKPKVFEVKKKKRGLKWRKYLLLIFVFIIIAAGIFAALTILPRANIEITTKKIDWSYTDSIVAYKNYSPEEKTIPAEFLILTRNTQLEFPATGKAMVKEKASGKITIYNVYSSDPQGLVVNTRFLAPDGKIFRLQKGIIIPGAKISEGKIIPSSIETLVIADQPGPNYNIGPVGRFTIPGFQGSPKYDNFYASSNEPMKGGFIGEAKVVTNNDIVQAKEKIAETLKSSLGQDFNLTYNDKDLKILDGAKDFKISKEEVKTQAGAVQDNFQIFGEAFLTTLAFKESDVLSLLKDLAQKDLDMDLEYNNFEINYGLSRADFESKKLSFPIEFKVKFVRPISLDQLKKQILNKNETELKTIIFSLPGLERAKVSLWPFWVKKVPQNEKALKISID